MLNKNELLVLLHSLDYPLWPKFELIKHDTNELSLSFTVEPDLKLLDGHFPEQPVLPGVAQVHWAVSLCQTLWQPSHQHYELKNTKFKNMILPNDHVALKISRLAKKRKSTFLFFQLGSGKEYSSGSIHYAEGH